MAGLLSDDESLSQKAKKPTRKEAHDPEKNAGGRKEGKDDLHMHSHCGPQFVSCALKLQTALYNCMRHAVHSDLVIS